MVCFARLWNDIRSEFLVPVSLTSVQLLTPCELDPAQGATSDVCREYSCPVWGRPFIQDFQLGKTRPRISAPHEHYHNWPWFGVQVLWAHGSHQGLYHKYAWVFYTLISVTATNRKLQWSIQLSAYPGSKCIGILSILKMQNRKYTKQWDIWSCECTFILTSGKRISAITTICNSFLL